MRGKQFLGKLLKRTGLAGAIASVIIGGLVAVDQPASVDASAAWTNRIIQLTNYERQRYGLRPLYYNGSLTYSAQNYAYVLATTWCWGHYCRSTPGGRIRAAGYRGWTYGENIAGGAWSPEQVHRMWMNSPGHRANILNPYFNEIGVGVAYGGRWGIYWTQNFGANRYYY